MSVEEIKLCPQCGEEMEHKLLGDEWWWICNDCGQGE